MKKTSVPGSIAYCLFPFLLYYVVYEAVGYALYLGVRNIASSGWIRAAVWTAAHAGDVSALVGAIAMAAGFLSIYRTAAREAPLIWRMHSRMLLTAAAVLLALSSALFLNLLISLSGVSSADSGASSAAAQTAAVSLPLGLLYYGVLSPFIEETIFRGITYGRIRRILRGAGATGTAPEVMPAEDKNRNRRTVTENQSGAPKDVTERRYCAGAAILSSLLFGIYHGNPVQGGYAFFMGLIFCAFLEMTGSLSATSLLHGAVNAMTLLLTQSGMYAQLCTPAWLAASLAIAVCSGIFLAGQSL